MSLISDTVAGLGTPRYDGQAGTLKLPSGRQETVFWNAVDQTWTSLPYIAMRQFDNVGMKSDGTPAAWKYPSHPENNSPYGATQFGFQIHTVLAPSELIDAGLNLQEHLSAEMGAGDYTSGLPPELALNWWRLADGANFLSPPPDNFGAHLVGGMEPPVFTRDIYRLHSTGWMNSPASPPSAGQNWYPEIYAYGSPTSFRNFTGRYRWIGGVDIGGSGSNELASQFPNQVDSVVSWHRASDIPLADNATVAEWADFSGIGRHLSQATLAKRPTVRRDSAGAMRHVRFTSGWMATAAGINNSQPWSIFLVMRQQAAGGTQQVWYANPGAGAPLIYRGDATDQVNVWAGAGSDLIYHRGSSWPSPWMVWSSVFSAGNASVWEGLTEVANGAAGTAGVSDYIFGNNPAESLPARIDVAEIVICASAPNNTKRTAMVNAMKARYGI